MITFDKIYQLKFRSCSPNVQKIHAHWRGSDNYSGCAALNTVCWHTDSRSCHYNPGPPWALRCVAANPAVCHHHHHRHSCCLSSSFPQPHVAPQLLGAPVTMNFARPGATTDKQEGHRHVRIHPECSLCGCYFEVGEPMIARKPRTNAHACHPS